MIRRLMDQSKRSWPVLLPLAAILYINAAALYHFAWSAYRDGTLFLSRRLLAGSGLGLLTLGLELALLVISLTPLRRRLSGLFRLGMGFLQRLGKLNWLFFGLTLGLFSFLLLGSAGSLLREISVRLFLLLGATLSAAVFMKAAGLSRPWGAALAASLLFVTLAYKAAAFLPEVSSYPFSIGWSEASRYYYASLYFSERVYDQAVNPTVLHPTRYLLQAIPFLIPDSPLWFHRLWQAVLWITTTFAAASLLARRLAIPDRLVRGMLVAWAFLFLQIGPVYYHLLIPVILVLGGFDRRRFWQSSAVILLASAWAGISRINWFPVPGMLAATLYFLEKPAAGRSLWQYLSRPVFWTISGTLVAFGAQAVYALWSGNPAEQFASSFTSDLLWYRLLPNPTYPLGILPGALLVSLPPLGLMAVRLSGRWRQVHPIRLLGIGGFLLVLFAGGLVVSTKIGGGSNLHNLDAYLALLLVVTVYVLFSQFREEIPASSERPVWQPQIAFGLAALLSILLPVYFSIGSGGPLAIPASRYVTEAFDILQTKVRDTVAQGGEVLFISERQIVTFHLMGDVPLVPDYERVFLMEMAMAGNPEYLGRFHEELRNQRFSLIISEPLFRQLKGRQEPFGEENDAWVTQVSEPILCSYNRHKNIPSLREVGVRMYVPRANPKDCP